MSAAAFSGAGSGAGQGDPGGDAGSAAGVRAGTVVLRRPTWAAPDSARGPVNGMTMPETTAPGAAVPGTGVPGTAVSGTAVSGTAVSGTAVPPAGRMPGQEPGPLRVNLLRVAFLLMGGGLAAVQWPTLVNHPQWTLYQGVARSMFVALSVLGLLGVLRPVRMLPVLLFEIGWKAVWLAVVALPAWASGSVDDDIRQTFWEVLPIVVVAAVVPWGYVFRHYVAGPVEPWRRREPVPPS